MKQPTTNIRAFAEIADELAEKHGGEWRRYACNLMSDFWLDRLRTFFDLKYLQYDARPKPVTRELIWRLLGDTGKPRGLRDVHEGTETTWQALAAAKPGDYSSYATLRDLAERLGLSDADARDWIQEYCEKHPLKVGGRKTDAESQNVAILDAFDKLCEEKKVSFKRGGLTQAAADLAQLFSFYQFDTIRKKIQPHYQAAKKQHECNQAAREK